MMPLHSPRLPETAARLRASLTATVLALLSPTVPVAQAQASAPAPTKKFEVRGERSFLGGQEFKIWGIRGGNVLMSPAVTERFVRNLDNMAAHGLNGLIVVIAGTNTGWPDEWLARNGFEPDGRLKPAFASRLEWLTREADRRGMVVGVTVFSPRTDQEFQGEEALKRGLQETGRFLVQRGLRNVFVDLMHEYNHQRVDQDLLREPNGPEKKAKMARWFKEVAPEIPLGVCSTIDTGSAIEFPGTDILIFQKSTPIPPKGFAINVEMHKRDNYDSEGVFSAAAFTQMYKWFDDYLKAPHAGFFFHSAFILGVTGRDGTAPHAEMGGYGKSDDDRGVRFYYDWVRDNVGRWEYPRHVPVKAAK
jgi:hypothetical protein